MFPETNIRVSERFPSFLVVRQLHPDLWPSTAGRILINRWMEWANAVNLDTAHIWEILGTTLDLLFGKFGPDALLSEIAENHNYFTKQKS